MNSFPIPENYCNYYNLLTITIGGGGLDLSGNGDLNTNLENQQKIQNVTPKNRNFYLKDKHGSKAKISKAFPNFLGL